VDFCKGGIGVAGEVHPGVCLTLRRIIHDVISAPKPGLNTSGLEISRSGCCSGGRYCGLKKRKAVDGLMFREAY